MMLFRRLVATTSVLALATLPAASKTAPLPPHRPHTLKSRHSAKRVQPTDFAPIASDFGTGPAADPRRKKATLPTLASLSALLNSVTWPNGRGLLTGQYLFNVHSLEMQILNGMGTWDPGTGVYTPSIPPGTIANSLGYTPLNKGGDTMSGALTLPPLAIADNTQKAVTSAFVQASQGCKAAASLGFANDSGGTDNLTAWNNWITSLNGADGCVSFTSGGWYQFSNQASATLALNQRLTIVANGAELYFPSSSGLVINYTTASNYASSQFNMRDANLTTSSAGGHSALIINGAASPGHIFRTTNLWGNTYRPHLASTGQYWDYGRYFNDLSNVNMVSESAFGGQGSTQVGIGLFINGSQANTPSAYNSVQENDFSLLAGVRTQGYWQGLVVINGNYTGVQMGIDCQAAVAENGCVAVGTQVSAVQYGFRANHIINAQIINSNMAVGAFGAEPAGSAIVQFNATTNSDIIGSTFQGGLNNGNYPTGIALDSASGNVQIMGNYVVGNNSNDIVGGYNGGTTAGLTIMGNRFATFGTVKGYATPYLIMNNPGGLQMDFGSTGAPLNFAGHLEPVADVQPTTTGCGTSPVLKGQDVSGQLTVGSGTGSVACSVTFAKAHTVYNTCTISPEGGSALPAYTVNNSGFSFSAIPVGTVLDYICSGV